MVGKSVIGHASRHSQPSLDVEFVFDSFDD